MCISSRDLVYSRESVQMHMLHTDLREIKNSSKMKFHLRHNFVGERGWKGDGFHLPAYLRRYVS